MCVCVCANVVRHMCGVCMLLDICVVYVCCWADVWRVCVTGQTCGVCLSVTGQMYGVCLSVTGQTCGVCVCVN